MSGLGFCFSSSFGLKIGPADAPRLNGHLDLPRPRSLRLTLLDAQVLRGVNHNGFH
jgi:hypothetical protein